MESSRFSDEQPRFESMEPVDSNGSTCDTFRVKLYGKLHFLKRLKPAFANDIRYQEAFQKEFETGYRLEHPHIVRYVSLSDEGILMEYVDGETLKQRIDSHPEYFNKKNSEKLLRQLLDAVGYLHAHQVLHLDLKPDNIMLTRIGNDVKLVDLGFCYTDTFVDTQGRTDRFAAPEQLTVGNVDERTDIYALGRIIEQLPKHNIYNKVIARCTASDKQDRFQSIDEISQTLHKRHSFSHYMVYLLLLVVVVSLINMLFSQKSGKDKLTLMDAPIVQVDTVPVRKNIQPTTIVIVKETKAKPKPSDPTAQMKKEMSQMMDKAYQITISSFCDSVFPSPSVGKQWANASTEFHSQTLQIVEQLARKYPQVPEATIRQEIESQFQNLVASVFNKMRENGSQSSTSE
ncbi:MAG: serine/threonine protein kinase [Prevotella sp.]|nr:serine/threonine protein kinase [Prevotella sp.]